MVEVSGTRAELIATLDAEPLFDYLIQNGVLDSFTANSIREIESAEERNTALVKHLNSHGNVAIGLFINALRLSGQLQLASSFDVTNRIVPVYGTGYWQKTRHKGQVVLEISVSAVRTYIPWSESATRGTSGKISDRWISMEDVRIALSPNRRPLNKSYENMTIFEKPPALRKKLIKEYAYDSSDEPDSSRTCCFCCLRKRKPKHHKKSKLAYVVSNEQLLNEKNSMNGGSGGLVSINNYPLSEISSYSSVGSKYGKQGMRTSTHRPLWESPSSYQSNGDRLMYKMHTQFPERTVSLKDNHYCQLKTDVLLKRRIQSNPNTPTKAVNADDGLSHTSGGDGTSRNADNASRKIETDRKPISDNSSKLCSGLRDYASDSLIVDRDSCDVSRSGLKKKVSLDSCIDSVHKDTVDQKLERKLSSCRACDQLTPQNTDGRVREENLLNDLKKKCQSEACISTKKKKVPTATLR